MKRVLFLKSASTPVIVKYAEIMDDNITIIDEIVEPLSKEFQPSTHLFTCIDDIILRNNLTYEMLDALYLASGPGSYTGARLLVTIAKTIAFICPNIICYDASILAILAEQSKKNKLYDVPIFAIAYARKGKYYCFGETVDESIDDTLLTTDQILKLTNNPCYVNGIYFADGLSEVEIISNVLDVDAWFKVSKQIENITLYEPYYLEKVNIG